MRQLVKSPCRIAVFSIAGFVGMLGLVVILGTLVRKSNVTSESVAGVAIGIIMLAAGVSICFLAPKLPQPSEDFKAMSREERIIADLRRQMGLRKQRMAALAVVLALSLVGTVWAWRQSSTLDSIMAPEHIDSFIAVDNPDREWPARFSSLYTIAGQKAKLIFYIFWFAAQTGLLIALLIIESVGRNGPELTLALWQRIQRLEKEIAELKNHGQADNPCLP